MENTNYSKLKIGFFNINGLVGETTFNTDFIEIIKNYDVITLTETWHKSSECIRKIKGNFPKNFNFIDNARNKKHKNSKRNSGGLLICYKKRLHENIVIIDKTSENMIWIKIIHHLAQEVFLIKMFYRLPKVKIKQTLNLFFLFYYHLFPLIFIIF